MVQKSLIEYIKTSLQQGYRLNTIINMLRNAGYTQYEINEAIKKAQQPKKTITTKTILITFIIIAVLTILTIISIKIITPPELGELKLTLKPYTTELTPGQELIVTAEIQNPSKREAKAIIDMFITGPEQKTQLPSKSIILEEKASIPIKTRIKQTAKPGTYTLTVILNCQSQIKTKSIQFLVKEKTKIETEMPLMTKEEKTKKELATCPGDCDDLNRCTKDECINGVCVHTPIIPCCGNNFCEQGETAENCPQDCKAKIKQTQEPEKAEQCQKLTGKNADNCFRKLAEKNNNQETCQYISDEEIRDACYIEFAYKKDFTVCDKITNQYTKNTCYTLQSITEIEKQT
ncbi:hypothetical protein DRJ22_00665 [Candidatus Woesearchaeota archaeon]|nr:MAG: hypothetical protein DRJ22_00665 [Candidatus Woesearchaeota archaeon]